MSTRTWIVDVPANVADYNALAPHQFGLQLSGDADDKKVFTIVRPRGSNLEINPPIITSKPQDAQAYADDAFKDGGVTTKVEVVCYLADAGPTGKFYEVTLKLSQTANGGRSVAQREGMYMLHYNKHNANAPVTLNFQPSESNPAAGAPFNINPTPSA